MAELKRRLLSLRRGTHGKIVESEERVNTRLSSQRSRLDNQQKGLGAARLQVVRQGKRLDSLSSSLDKLTERLNSLRAKITKQGERLDIQDDLVGTLRVGYGRLEHQISAIELRLDRLDDKVTEGPLVADGAERKEARSLLDEMRQEHSRVRARFQVMVSYEERIRRLEEALRPTPDR